MAINNVCSSSCVIASILLFFTHYEFSAQPSLSIFVNAKILIVVRFLPLVIDHYLGNKSLPW